MQDSVESKNRLITFLSIAVIVLSIVIAIFSFQGISTMVSSSKQQVVENAAQNVLLRAVATIENGEDGTVLQELESTYNASAEDITVAIQYDEDTDVLRVMSESGDREHSALEVATVTHDEQSINDYLEFDVIYHPEHDLMVPIHDGNQQVAIPIREDSKLNEVL